MSYVTQMNKYSRYSRSSAAGCTPFLPWWTAGPVAQQLIIACLGKVLKQSNTSLISCCCVRYQNKLLCALMNVPFLYKTPADTTQLVIIGHGGRNLEKQNVWSPTVNYHNNKWNVFVHWVKIFLTPRLEMDSQREGPSLYTLSPVPSKDAAEKLFKKYYQMNVFI